MKHLKLMVRAKPYLERNMKKVEVIDLFKPP
jgi:hypothetical protein